MSTRQSRYRQGRVVLGVSLAISLAVHGVLFGALDFQVRQQPSESPAGTPEPVALEYSAIEVVEIREVPEEIVLEQIIAEARVAVATPTPEKLPEPAAGEMSMAKAGDAPASHAVTGADVDERGDAFPSTTMLADAGSAARFAASLRPRLGILKEMPRSTREPVEMLEPNFGDGTGEGDGEEEKSWWRRLGMKFGIGGGEICRPRPELIVDEDKEKPEKK